MRVSGLESLLLPAFAVMVMSAYANVLRSTFYAIGKLTYEAYAILAESVVLLAGTLYGVQTHRGVDFFLWCYVFSYGFSCAYFVAVITAKKMVRWGWELDLRFVASWFRKSLPFALAFVITTLYFKIDVPLLLHFRGFTELGWYGFATRPIEALLFVPVTILNVAFPVLAVYHTESRERLLHATGRFYKTLFGLGWPITVGTVLLAPGINGLFDRSGKFGEAALALQILGLGIFLMFVTNAFIAALNAMDRQVLFTWAAVVSLVVNVALNLVLIPAYGYLGAAWATNASGSAARMPRIMARSGSPSRSPVSHRARAPSSARRSTGAAARASGERWTFREDSARPSDSRTVGQPTTSIGIARSAAMRRITRTCWASFWPK